MLNDKDLETIRKAVIIPLKEKLLELLNEIKNLHSDKFGSEEDLLSMQTIVNLDENNIVNNYKALIKALLDKKELSKEAIGIFQKEILDEIKLNLLNTDTVIKNKFIFFLEGLGSFSPRTDNHDFLVKLKSSLSIEHENHSNLLLMSSSSSAIVTPRNPSNNSVNTAVNILNNINEIKSKIEIWLQQHTQPIEQLDETILGILSELMQINMKKITNAETDAIIGIFQMIKNEKPEILESLINHTPLYLNQKTNSLLLWALDQENLKLALFLLQNGGNIEVANQFGINAIHMLAMVHPALSKVDDLIQVFHCIKSTYSAEKLALIINDPRITDDHQTHGIPLFKVVSYSGFYKTGDTPTFVNEEEYINTIELFIDIWESAGAKIENHQLFKLLPKIIEKGDAAITDEYIAFRKAYLQKLHYLFPTLFNVENLLRTSDKFDSAPNINTFTASLAQDHVLFKFICELYPGACKDPQISLNIQSFFQKKFAEKVRDSFNNLFHEGAYNTGSLFNNIEDKLKSFAQQIKDLHLTKNYPILKQHFNIDPNFQEQLKKEIVRVLHIDDKKHISIQDKNKITQSIDEIISSMTREHKPQPYTQV